MKRIIFTAVLVSFFCSSAFAQADKTLCPKISILLPTDVLYPEQPVTFSAKVGDEAQSYDVKYFWIISGGKINKGQGTQNIEFAPTEEDQSTNIGVAFKVVGLPKECSDTVSDFVPVASLPIGEPVDTFGKLNLNDYKARLDNLLIGVINYPNSEGLIELVFDRRDSRKYKITLLKNIIKYLDYRKIDKTRFTFAINDNDHQETILWVVPQGAKFPESRSKGYKRITEGNFQVIKAEDLTRKINDLCL